MSDLDPRARLTLARWRLNSYDETCESCAENVEREADLKEIGLLSLDELCAQASYSERYDVVLLKDGRAVYPEQWALPSRDMNGLSRARRRDRALSEQHQAVIAERSP
jgi:hypothetical protein